MSRGDESAFPVNDTVHPNGQVQYGAYGMTIRERMALEFMGQMVSNPNRSGAYRHYADDAVAFADALLAAMEAKKP